MAYYDTYNNVQFLDLSGVDEDEKKWILTSLQGNHPCVEGPWTKDNEELVEVTTSEPEPECTIQTNIPSNNGIPAMSYEQYPSPPMIISNHVSPISAQVYPQSYQATIPMYQPAFVPQVQYGGQMMPMVPATMVPVNAPIMSFGNQPVTYATYATPTIQANPIYNMPPVITDCNAKMNTPHHYHQHPHHQQQQQEFNVRPHQQQQQQPLPVHHQQQPQPHIVQSVTSNNGSVKPLPQNKPVPQVQQAQQQPQPVLNGPVRIKSPVEVKPVIKVPVVTNGHDVSIVPVVVSISLSTTATVPAGTPAPVIFSAHTPVVSIQTNGISTGTEVPTVSEPKPVLSSPEPVLNIPATKPASTAETTVTNNTTGSSGGSNGGMTWASLFNKKNNVTSIEQPETKQMNNNRVGSVAQTTTNNNTKNVVAPLEDNRKKSPLAQDGDPNYYRMGEILVNYKPDNKITSLQPRGLINRRNYCYINSILQALLACPPMYNLLHALGQNITNEQRKHTHIIDNVVKFVKEFNLLPAAQRVSRRSEKVQKKEQNIVVTYDRPFEPNWIYKMLNGMQSDSFVIEGRQEDAEEFLGCLLNGMNDEMLELMKLVRGEVTPIPEPVIEEGYKSDGDKEWQVIGPKNKGCITRRMEIVRTPLSDIFGGHIKSKLLRAGDQDTNNIQPFFTLQLNIEKANTVREALEAWACKNQLEGVTSSKTNEEVEAWQQVTLEELPVVLILHLKCFDFKMDGCTKIVKALEFPVDLKIDSKWLSQKTNYQPKEKQYKLFAVVYHDGKEATNGHYLTDAYHVGYASWLRFDDSSVKTVLEEQVLKPHGTRVPYLLFYRRCDTVRNK